ncbi:glycoside hydrolase family 65 [Evansella sp. AB-rgal1]|uniref:glycoside hydrolase family 65 n=1 Tax=Evansella sp. AB-rgal1 TaxID=3242696 RepID=UPI00359CBD83
MIDRKSLVTRHNPVITKVEPLSPLSVGNSEFAFTADITGLQTFPESYKVPLGTQSQWGWHSTIKQNLYELKDITLQNLDTYGRDVPYPLYPEDKEEAYHWLRQNPHRIHLGQLAFTLIKENGDKAEITNIEDSKQILNLWEGSLLSEFYLEGKSVSVITVVHPRNDEIGVKVNSELLSENRLQVSLKFSAPDMYSNNWDECGDLDWGNKDRHNTEIKGQSLNSLNLKRTMDEDSYEVAWNWNAGEVQKTEKHEFVLTPKDEKEFIFSVSYSKTTPETSDFEETIRLNKKYWEEFWMSGGAIDFSGSKDERAHELERRVVLSQFLTAIHCGGSLPPQETGLMYNSWFGKFHLEMHWWHAAHFPLWGRTPTLEKSLHWYNKILPLAKELAASQGYEGARWPKQVGPDGKQSPSVIAPVLIWQQPHPIAMAELCYQSNKNKETLECWKKIVFESADFMASYAVWVSEREEYVLGPPLIPAQENHKPEESMNPPFELEYWKHGLELAIRWAERLGVDSPSKWKEVAEGLADPPHKDGVYLAHENCPETFTKYNHDHPSMVGAFGILPGTLIDKEIMKQTLRKVMSDWQWDTAWGWDFPMCAMTAARLGDREMAVDFLLMDATKNTYLPNGHNYQREGLTAYLPGNGGLLTAVSMMACGWQGANSGDLPGFPKYDSWSVKWEGLHPLL